MKQDRSPKIHSMVNFDENPLITGNINSLRKVIVNSIMELSYNMEMEQLVR